MATKVERLAVGRRARSARAPLFHRWSGALRSWATGLTVRPVESTERGRETGARI